MLFSLQHHAVVSEAPKRKATVELLIKKKADLNAQNKELLTPLHCATDKAHIDALEVLIKHGANVSSISLCVGACAKMYAHTYIIYVRTYVCIVCIRVYVPMCLILSAVC